MSDINDLARRLGAELTERRHAVQPCGQLRDYRGIEWVHTDEEDWLAGGAGDPQPDLTDPATAGFLLSLLPDPVAIHSPSGAPPGEGRQNWSIVVTLDALTSDPRRSAHRGATLGEAAARALLALWGSQ